MIKKKKDYIIPLIVAGLHLIITFFTDKFIFNLSNINNFNYYGCKFLLFIILIFIWTFLYKAIIKKDKEKRKYLKYFAIYMAPLLILLLLCWPGTWFGSDVYNFYNLSVNAEFLYYLHYLSSVFYIIGFMLFPCVSGAIILLVILFGIVVSFIIKNFYDIYKSKWVYLLYIPFFLPHTLFYTFFANRPIMFGICYSLLIVLLIIDKLKENKLTKFKLLFLAILTAIVSNWRSEAIYLVLSVPLFIFFVYNEEVNLKNSIKILSIFILAFFIVSLPQKYEELRTKTDVPSDRNLPMIINPLSYMLTFELKGDNLDKDLENIDKVLDIELMKKYPSYMETPSAWMEGGCIKKYTKEEYDEFMNSYIDILKNNYLLFFKTKLLTFANASGIYVDNFTSKNLYSSDDEFILDRIDTKPLFGYKVRKLAYSFLEGNFTDGYNNHIVYRIIGNFLLPMLFIAIIFLYSIWKKNLFYFLLTGMLIGHSVILFFTAPASYFMYYFNVYISGWILGIYFVINKIILKKNKLNN